MLTWTDEDEYTDWLNSLMEHAPEHYDSDEAMEAIVLRYIRDLEALAKQAHRIVFQRGHGDEALWDALEQVEGPA